MLDTVDFKLTVTEAKGVDFLSEIPPCLDDGTIGVHDFSSSTVVTGKLDNYSVSISDGAVRVKNGSLCKWHLGDNYSTLSRVDVREAIERMSDTLHLPMERATVTRLDVGQNLLVKHPVNNYLNHLGMLNYSHRLQQPNSLYYKSRQNALRLVFYDKNREQREHREPVPELYRDCNVLRYEQRYMARLPRLLNIPGVTGELLFDEKFYIRLLDLWRESYNAINKVNDITLNFSEMKSRRDLNRVGILGLVERFGGEVELYNHIKAAQRRDELTAKQAHDLRAAIKTACSSKTGLTEPSDEITELDRLIAEAIRYYR